MGQFSEGVEPASKKSIQITFTYRRRRCRERLKLEPTPANLKAAARHLAAINDAIAKGTFDYAVTFPDSPRRFWFETQPGAVQSVERYLEGWLAAKKKQIKSSTYNDYRKIIRQAVSEFGSLRLHELKRPVLKAWLSKMTCTNKRLANIQSVLRSALSDAVHDELIDANPLYEWAYRNVAEVKEDDDVDPFTFEEEALILKELTGQPLNLYTFLFWTGMRPSEAAGLEWRDIDWQSNEAQIRRALTQAATDPEAPKTKRGRRIVKLLPPAIAALQAQREYTYMLGGAVFHDPQTNARWAGDQPMRKKFWMPALRRAKVRYRRPYQTRHTFASRMLSAGESPMWVAAQLGHADWAMIRTIYGKWIPETIPDAGMRAMAVFEAKKKEGTG